jgi:hypothetical protein
VRTMHKSSDYSLAVGGAEEYGGMMGSDMVNNPSEIQN